MLHEDPYFEERPQDKPEEEDSIVPPPIWIPPTVPGEFVVPGIFGDWGGNGTSGSDGTGGGGSGGSGGSGGGSGSGDIWYDLIDSSWGMTTPVLLTDGSGTLLTDGSGNILKGVDGCLTIDIDCQIQGEDGKHVRCIILRSIMSEPDTQTEATSANFLLQNLVGRGRLTLAACWQAGHWDYASVHTVRFRIRDGQDQEVITSWIKLSMNPSCTNFAELSLDETGLQILSIGS